MTIFVMYINIFFFLNEKNYISKKKKLFRTNYYNDK